MNALSIYSGWLLKRHMRTALIWTISLALYLVMIVALFPSFQGVIDTAYSQIPGPLAEAFNMSDMSTPLGFLGTEIWSYAPLVIAFFPIMLLAGAISGEEERGSLDIFLAQPLSRRDMVLANTLSASVWTFVIMGAAGVATWLTAVMMDIDISFADAMLGNLNVLPISLLFGCVALVISAIVRTKGTASGTAFGVMFLLYLVDLTGKINTDLESIRAISPFKWYGSYSTDGINWAGVGILLGVSIVLVLASVVLFQRRDVYT
ncbi:MAG: ABC transporter permease [Thermomicrobiales bacterium]|nr:ABC transporter permease [Thermomicrobiales bacterium]MCO5218873.1 ABC transporter permease [Thermomicrobiales bacterium]MCO5225689.1 ABC transporter permease [Thermomicrobiales bacterium]MCO5227959.1 ABC transporter permease [Thermomicrobiales bacterium]